MAYKARVINSSKELTAREKLVVTSTQGMINLNRLAKSSDDTTIHPEYWAVVEVENDKAEGDKIYNQYVIVDTEGVEYYTGSESFWNEFSRIEEAMRGEDEDWSIRVMQLPSQNREGQYFLTCEIV